MKNLLAQISGVQKALATNADVDWIESDPSGEFLTLSDQLKAIVDGAKEQSIISNAGKYLCEEDGNLLDQYKALQEGAKDNKEFQMADHVEGVQVIEEFEFSFTIDSLLNLIEADI